MTYDVFFLLGEFLTDQEEKILDDCAKRVIKDCHVQLDSSPLGESYNIPLQV